MKAHLLAIIAAVQAYRSAIAQHKADKAKAEQNRLFLEAAKNDPLSMLFEARYCRAGMEADFRDGKR